MIKIRTIRALLSAAAMALGSAAYALQIVEPVEGNNSFVKISAKELTRIAVENGKLKQLVASEGELLVERDTERGQVYIRPLVIDKPINVRAITSSNHTYSLILQAVDSPQEDVVIRDAALKASERSKREEAGESSFVRAIRALVVGMAAEAPPGRLTVRKVNREVALWEGVRFVQTHQYEDRTLSGEKYLLTNVGRTQVRMVEQELYRPGVLAIAIDSMTLEPGESATVFIVTAGGR
jgi:conjugal transfer pilus assembly protein TraK